MSEELKTAIYEMSKAVHALYIQVPQSVADDVYNRWRRVIDNIQQPTGEGNLKELEELRAWKESAMKLLADDQEIGQLIGVRLGESVHDKILPYIKGLKTKHQEKTL